MPTYSPKVCLYAYNRYSQLIGITRPDGGKVTFTYDEDGRLITVTNPAGSSQHWLYNEDGTLKERTDETGAKTTFTYNEQKLTESVTNAKGDTIRLAYDQDHNLCQVTLPDYSTANWTYDHLGNCLEEINPQGAANKYQYDALNRLIKANLADGNNIDLRYNGYHEVVHAKDNHTQIEFEYTILGSVKTRIQGDRKVGFRYDNEERLIAVVNEKEEEYLFQRDLEGNVIKETGFDQATRNYVRDNSGLITEIIRPGDRYTKYQHDKLGNITRADYHDHTWDTFEYNESGQLIQAANQHTKVKFQRDPAGQIVKEWQGDHWVAGEFDQLGNRQEISSSLGAKILTSRNPLGQVIHLAAAQTGQSTWAAQLEYNNLGQEIKRLLPGEVVSNWQYDITGRPVHHQVQSHRKDLRQREYQWDANHRLKKITNLLNQNQISFNYDQFNNLVSSNLNNSWSFMNRCTDQVGNLYETTTLTDRIYSPGSKLTHTQVNTNELKNVYQGGHGKLVTKGTEFAYDEEGNLIKKTQANGDIWQYEYYGNGMMSKVIRPDNTEISFKYDSLGRRIEKKTPEKTKHFLWDGNNPLHEWEDDNLITWVFDDGFVPTAKLTTQGNYSIITDYLGTPAEAYDSEGNCIWSAELDIYGRVKEFSGEVDFIPFRFQGQYDDIETGLYCNRFRYYAPEEGVYTQPDPTGTEGGINLFAYVHNPNSMIDVFGLSGRGGMTHRLVQNNLFNELSRIHGPENVFMEGKINLGNGNSRFGDVIVRDPGSRRITEVHQVGDMRTRGGFSPSSRERGAIMDIRQSRDLAADAKIVFHDKKGAVASLTNPDKQTGWKAPASKHRKIGGAC